MTFKIRYWDEFYAVAVFNSCFINSGRSQSFVGPDISSFGINWQQRSKSFLER